MGILRVIVEKKRISLQVLSCTEIFCFQKVLWKKNNDRLVENTDAVLYMCSYKKVFWKYPANLQENTHVEVRFQ